MLDARKIERLSFYLPFPDVPSVRGTRNCEILNYKREVGDELVGHVPLQNGTFWKGSDAM